MDEVERKIVKTRPHFDFNDDSDQVQADLDLALTEHEKVERLIDYFILGLFLVFMMYTLYALPV